MIFDRCRSVVGFEGEMAAAARGGGEGGGVAIGPIIYG